MFLSPRIRACLLFLRRAHTHTIVDHNNYYKILGINPSASQAEIKAAYFELSKKHHPDRNQGSEESAKLFRLIKTAYEVLGSEKKRIQYDKDRVFSAVRRPSNSYATYNHPDYKDDAERMHYQSQVRRPFRRYSQGKTTFYDFDAWYDAHYGKNKYEEYEAKKPRHFREETFYQVNFRSGHTGQMKAIEKLKHLCTLLFFILVLFNGVKRCKTNDTSSNPLKKFPLLPVPKIPS